MNMGFVVKVTGQLTSFSYSGKGEVNYDGDSNTLVFENKPRLLTVNGEQRIGATVSSGKPGRPPKQKI